MHRELVHGNKVQETSAKFMNFLVKDFLDYAQIKANGFRKHLTDFNIRRAVEDVMTIQRQKALDGGILFTASFTNIHDGENDKEGKYSPIIYSDEQRIMQVLLNL